MKRLYYYGMHKMYHMNIVSTCCGEGHKKAAEFGPTFKTRRSAHPDMSHYGNNGEPETREKNGFFLGNTFLVDVSVNVRRPISSSSPLSHVKASQSVFVGIWQGLFIFI